MDRGQIHLGRVLDEISSEGSSVPRPRKFTPELVLSLRQRYHDGDTLTLLARELRMNSGTIYSIVTGHAYKEVGGPIATPVGHTSRRALDRGRVYE